MKLKTITHNFLKGSIIWIGIFVWIISVLALYPPAPNGQNTYWWFGKYFDFNQSTNSELVLNGNLITNTPTEDWHTVNLKYLKDNLKSLENDLESLKNTLNTNNTPTLYDKGKICGRSNTKTLGKHDLCLIKSIEDDTNKGKVICKLSQNEEKIWSVYAYNYLGSYCCEIMCIDF